jgi:hypothetical protein
MSKLDQVLVIEPANELKFIGPFSNVVTSELKLTNPTAKKIAFKVKTTAPKRYCVRPNSGLLEPNAQVVVSVMLQPFEYDPAEKNNHKFMVQSMYAPTGTLESLDQLWKDAGPTQLMDSKLKCLFELSSTGHDAVQNNLDKPTDDNAKVTPQKSEPLSTGRSAPPAPAVEKPPVKVSGGGSGDDEVRRVVAECQQLSAEIQRLREDNNKLRDEGVRLRKVASSSTGSAATSPGTAAMHAGGYQQAIAESSPLTQPAILYLIAMLILGVIIGKFLL